MTHLGQVTPLGLVPLGFTYSGTVDSVDVRPGEKNCVIFLSITNHAIENDSGFNRIFPCPLPPELALVIQWHRSVFLLSLRDRRRRFCDSDYSWGVLFLPSCPRRQMTPWCPFPPTFVLVAKWHRFCVTFVLSHFDPAKVRVYVLIMFGVLFLSEA